MKDFPITLNLMLLAGGSYAQKPSSGGPTPTPQVNPAAVPLDGGASLLASGVAYGLRRLHQRRRAGASGQA